MIINFVGLFNKPGYVGEISDETHLARELERAGHTVNRIQRDVWKAICDGETNPNWPQVGESDINLIAKWPHFNDGNYIRHLKAAGGGSPVFYWVWDFMYDQGFPDWHISMAQAADLYLSGEQGIANQYINRGIKFYYFQMDCCDGDIPVFTDLPKIHDVIFTGSCIGQGHRKEWLPMINKEISVKVWSWNPDDWKALGLEAYPAVYGEEYNKLIAQSKIVLGFNVEANCWGYWSNRVGKVLRAGGFLLQEYAPGMETQLPLIGVDYFSTPAEAITLIKEYLIEVPEQVRAEDRVKFTSAWKMLQLTHLMQRYLKGDPKKWNRLS